MSTQRRPLHHYLKKRRPLFIACLVSVAVCLGYAAVRDSLTNPWLQSNGGGVPYVTFWVLLLATCWPEKRLAFRLSLLAVLATCGLEFLQLYNPEPLAAFRRTRFGAALLGSGFVWSDFPPYFIGGVIGWLIVRWLGNEESQPLKTLGEK